MSACAALPSRVLVLAASVMLSACAALPTTLAPGAAHTGTVEVKLIAFGDFHGALLSPGRFAENTAVPVAERAEVGGAAYLAAHVAEMRARNPLHAVLAAGDLVSASAPISAFFHDEPTVEVLNRIGLEFSAAGNHEFDRGVAELLRLQNGGCRMIEDRPMAGSCVPPQPGHPSPSTAAFAGARFKWLAANVISAASGAPLLPAWAIKEFDGVALAFIGVTLRSTPRAVIPTAVAGLRFDDEADTVNALLPALRARGIEAIVLIAHQGGRPDAGLHDINGCDGDLRDSAIADIVARLDDAVDLVISAHSHEAYNCSASTEDVRRDGREVRRTPRPSGLPNAAGRRIPVSNAGAYGRVLSEIDLEIERHSGDVRAVRLRNRLVSHTLAPDAQVAAIVASYDALAAPLANRVIGAIGAELPNRTDEAGNMPAGELVADAQLAATAAPTAGAAEFAFTNPGGVRAPGFRFASSALGEGDGKVTFGEAFAVQPFGNTLVTLELSAQQLKDLLEQQFAGCRGQQRTRILIPSRGLHYQWRQSAGCDQRIRSLQLLADDGSVREQIVDAHGRLLAPQRRYRLTVNSFLAAGGDGFDTLRDGREPRGGGLDIDALAAFFARFHGAEGPPYWPDAATMRTPRIVRLP